MDPQEEEALPDDAPDYLDAVEEAAEDGLTPGPAPAVVPDVWNKGNGNTTAVKKGMPFPAAKYPICAHRISCAVCALSGVHSSTVIQMIRAFNTSTAINRYLVGQGLAEIDKNRFTKCKKYCLKLPMTPRAERGGGAPLGNRNNARAGSARSTRPSYLEPDIPATDLSNMSVPTPQEILDISMKLFVDRATRDSRTISNQLLGTVLGAALKAQAAKDAADAKRNPKSKTRDAMKSIFSQLEDGKDAPDADGAGDDDGAEGFEGATK